MKELYAIVITTENGGVSLGAAFASKAQAEYWQKDYALVYPKMKFEIITYRKVEDASTV